MDHANNTTDCRGSATGPTGQMSQGSCRRLGRAAPAGISQHPRQQQRKQQRHLHCLPACHVLRTIPENLAFVGMGTTVAAAAASTAAPDPRGVHLLRRSRSQADTLQRGTLEGCRDRSPQREGAAQVDEGAAVGVIGVPGSLRLAIRLWIRLVTRLAMRPLLRHAACQHGQTSTRWVLCPGVLQDPHSTCGVF